jgi:hypothetical protein
VAGDRPARTPRITDALRDLVFEPDPHVSVGEVLDRYFAAGYTHRADGSTLSRAEFEAMVVENRVRIIRGSAVVLDELRDGSTYAERHRFHIELEDGSVQDREVAIFGDIDAGGRFTHLSETGFPVDGSAR